MFFRINPLNPKIWLLILPSSCIRFSYACKLVTRTINNFTFFEIIWLIFLHEKSLKFHARMFMAWSAHITKEIHTSVGENCNWKKFHNLFVLFCLMLWIAIDRANRARANRSFQIRHPEWHVSYTIIIQLLYALLTCNQ